MSEARKRRLLTRRRWLVSEDKRLTREEFRLVDDPEYIREFENFYLRKGYSPKLVRRLAKVYWFRRRIQRHIPEHYAIRLELRATNRKLMRLG